MNQPGFPSWSSGDVRTGVSLVDHVASRRLSYPLIVMGWCGVITFIWCYVFSLSLSLNEWSEGYYLHFQYLQLALPCLGCPLL